jgi:hypothetical protein
MPRALVQTGMELEYDTFGSHLLFVADMGHDMPEPLWPLFVDSIHGHLRRAG